MAGEDDLVNFILRSREKRRTDAQIARALLSVGWKKERVETAFRIVREKEFLAKQEAERGDDEPPGQAKPSPEKTIANGQIQQASAPMQPEAGKPTPAAVPTQPAAAQAKGAFPQEQQPVPAQKPAMQPPAKKQPFPFPNIFGKKEQAPPASPAQLASQPQAQPPVRPPQIPLLPKAQPVLPQQQIQPPQKPVQQQPQKQGAAAPPFAVQPSQQAPPSLQLRNAPKTGVPMASLWPSGSPTSALPYELPYQKVADESQVKNPAFAKIEKAATKLPENKFLPIIIVAFIVLLFVAGAAYYFLVLGGSSGPRQPSAPQISLPANNTTIIANVSAAPILPPVNISNNTSANVSNKSSANPSQQTQAQPPAKPAPSGFDELAKIVDSASALPPNYRISSESRLGKGGATEQLTQETTYAKRGKMRRDTTNIIGRNAGIEKRQYALGEAVYDCVKIGDGWTCGEAAYQLAPPAPLQLTRSSLKSDKYSGTIVSDGTAQISGVTASCFNETVEGGYLARFCIGQDALILYSKKPSNGNGGVLDLETTKSGYTTAVSDADFELPSALAANATAATPKQGQNNSTQTIPILFVPQPAPPAPAPVPEPKLVRTTRHISTGGESVLRYCKSINATFLQAHYTESWGVECLSSKGKEGFANQSQFPAQCDFLYCCVDDPSRDFSRGYDYFECGYYE